jgi:hypothetical protein
MISLFFASWIEYVIHAILIIGVVGTFGGAIISKIPFISQYGNIIKGVSMIALIAGIFFEGYNFALSDYRDKVKEFEGKVAIAQQQAKDANSKIETKIVERVKVVKDTQYVIQEKIKEVEKKIDAECKVTPEAIDILNEAARTPKKETK